MTDVFKATRMHVVTLTASLRSRRRKGEGVGDREKGRKERGIGEKGRGRLL